MLYPRAKLVSDQSYVCLGARALFDCTTSIDSKKLWPKGVAKLAKISTYIYGTKNVHCVTLAS